MKHTALVLAASLGLATADSPRPWKPKGWHPRPWKPDHHVPRPHWPSKKPHPPGYSTGTAPTSAVPSATGLTLVDPQALQASILQESLAEKAQQLEVSIAMLQLEARTIGRRLLFRVYAGKAQSLKSLRNAFSIGVGWSNFLLSHSRRHDEAIGRSRFRPSSAMSQGDIAS